MKTQPQRVISQLEAHSSRIAKEAILEAAIEESLDEFFLGLKMALDPLYTFGVKQVPEYAKSSDISSMQGLSWQNFEVLAEQLASRELTGHAARDAIKLAMQVATPEQWDGFYRRILIKDLRCGVSEKTVNKVAKKLKRLEYQIPVFTCMLAHDSANHESKLKGMKQCEVKLDGVRVLTIIHDVNGNRIEMFSRNGKQFNNFGHIIDEIQAALKNTPMPYPVVLDGEVMSASFQDLMKQVHRKENVEADDAVLHLFDMIPLDRFKSGRYDKPQHFRSEAVKSWVDEHSQELAHVRALDWEHVDLDTEEGFTRFKEINKIALAGGYEGILIKDVNASYECKRSHSWLKSKPVITLDLEVTDLVQGTGRNQDRLGALVCSGVDDDKHIEVNVGSGFSDSQRDSFWSNPNDILGQIVEVKADAITQNQDGSYSLRFPRFSRFRGFHAGEKC